MYEYYVVNQGFSTPAVANAGCVPAYGNEGRTGTGKEAGVDKLQAK